MTNDECNRVFRRACETVLYAAAMALFLWLMLALTAPRSVMGQPGTSVFGGNGTGSGGTNGGVALSAFDQTQFSTNGGSISAKSGINETNVVMQGTLNTVNTLFPTNIPQLGDPYRMNSTANPWITWYFNGNPANQNVAQQNTDSELRILDVNPWNSGGGVGFSFTTTNAANANGAGAISTNTDGQPIYLWQNDPHIWSIQGVGAQDLGNNIPGAVILIGNGEINVPFAVATVGNQFPPGGNGNYSFVQFNEAAGGTMITHFPLLVSNVFNCTNPAWKDAFRINHNTGVMDYLGVVNHSNNVNIVNGSTFGVNGNGWAGGTGNGLIQLQFGDPTQRANAKGYIGNSQIASSVGPIEYDVLGGIGAGMNIEPPGGDSGNPAVPGNAMSLVYQGVTAAWWKGTSLNVVNLFTSSNGNFSATLNGQNGTITNTETVGRHLIVGTAGSFGGNLDVVSSINTTNFSVFTSGLAQSPQYNVSQTNGLVIGATTNTPSGTIAQFDFVAGTVYPNTNGRPILVLASVVVNAAGVSGNAAMQLRITGTGGTTNAVGLNTTVTTIAESYTNQLSGICPANGTYQYINVSAGAGDSTSILAGSSHYIVY